MNTTEIRILLVDDHQLILRGLRQLIATKAGLTVVGEAFDGQSAINQVAASAPQVVLMDVHLPGESGVDITRRLLAQFPSVKVIALSGDPDLDLVMEALQAGVAGYVLKVNGPEEVFKAIQAVMDNDLYLSPEVASGLVKNFMKRPGGRKSGGTGVVLNDREQQLLQLVAEGVRNTEIGGQMALTAKSVETYRARLMKKLGCATTIGLVRYAIREGIIQA